MNDARQLDRTKLERVDHWAPLLGGALACALCAAGCGSSSAHAAAGAPDAGPSCPAKDGPIALPNGAPGIEFDDIQWAPHLRKVIVPAGRTGSVDLIDPDTCAVTELKGLTKSDQYTVPPAGPIRSGTRYGSTSATEADRYVAALDGTAQTLNIFDPVTTTLLSSVPLGAAVDYVHYVASKREIWVTMPTPATIDVYSLPSSGVPTPQKVVSISVPNGPESLVIDETRGRAYTNAFYNASFSGGNTYSIDLSTHAIVETWTTPCVLALGVALDEVRGFAFVLCGENGNSVVLDVNHGGAILGTQNGGAGANILAYNPTLHHLYSPSGNTSEIFVMDVPDNGQITLLGKLLGADRGFSDAVDDRGHVYVFYPDQGSVIRSTDSFPSH